MREEHENIDRSHWATPKRNQPDHIEPLTTSVTGVPATPLEPEDPTADRRRGSGTTSAADAAGTEHASKRDPADAHPADAQTADAHSADAHSSDAPSADDLMHSPMLGPSTTPITLPITLEEEARLRASGKPVPKNLFGFLNKVDPRVVALLGSLAVGMNPVFVRLAGENAATAVFFRFAIALIPLGIFAILEMRLNGRMRTKDVLLHLLAGAFFGLDVGLWIPGVLLAGAGIATVAGNLQVIIVPLLALLIFREKLSKPFIIAIPVMLAGVVLLSGVIEHGVGGDAFLGVLLAVAGGIAYAGYIMIIGRARPTGHASTNVFLSSFSSMIVGTAVASGWGAPNFTPDLQPLIMLILMAVFSQVIGWVATASALPRLDSSTGSMLLLTQPLVAIVGGVVLVGEQISVLQWVGIAVIIAAVWFTSMMSGRKRRR